METKTLIHKLSLAVSIFLLLTGSILIYWLYGVIYNTPTEPVSKNEQVKINYDLYTSIENAPSYGVSVSAEEPGFSRVNPFALYKEPPAPPAPATPPVPLTTP